jgi:hypothetical protein
VKLRTDILPGDRFDSPRPVIGHAALNFFRPRLFDAFVSALILEAFQQQARELGAFTGW